MSLGDQQVAAFPHSSRAVGRLCLTQGPQPAPASWLEERGCFSGPDPTRGQALSNTILHVHRGALGLRPREEGTRCHPRPGGLRFWCVDAQTPFSLCVPTVHDAHLHWQGTCTLEAGSS